jgi:hypothetical protein
MSEETLMSGDQTTDTTGNTDQTTASTDVTPLVSNDGVFGADWHQRIGDGMQIPDNMKGVKDIQTILKGSIEGQAMIGRMGTEIGTLKQQVIDAGGIGSPETAADYSMTRKPEGVEDDKWDQGMADKWAGIFKDQDIGDAKASAIVEQFGEYAKEQLETSKNAEVVAQQTKVDTLRNDWGSKHDENMEKAITVANKLGLDVDNPDIGNNTTLIRALHKISDSVSESVIQGAGPGNSVGLESNQGARAEARDIAQNPANPLNAAFNDPGHEMHAQAHLKVDTLNMQHSKLMAGG